MRWRISVVLAVAAVLLGQIPGADARITRITLVESPAPEPPMSEILSGVLKNSAIPCNSALVVEPSSHISRKNAIIAVTKSAQAIFQAPPWCACAPFLTRLTMIGLWESSLMNAAAYLPLRCLTSLSSSLKVGRSVE